MQASEQPVRIHPETVQGTRSAFQQAREPATRLDDVTVHAMRAAQLRRIAPRHGDVSRFVAMDPRYDEVERRLHGNRPATAAQRPQQQAHRRVHGGDSGAVGRGIAARKPHEEPPKRRVEPGVVVRSRQGGPDPLQERLVLQFVERDARERGTHLDLGIAGAGEVVHRERGRLLAAEQDRQQLRERISLRGPQPEPQAIPVVTDETLSSTEAHGRDEHRALVPLPYGLTGQGDRLDGRDGYRVVHHRTAVRGGAAGVTHGGRPGGESERAPG